eukprot:CAMPEP_0202691274 /NCGR_PEP_ID=MMETSP1385-20130828/6035_1 /ASSEMBLY_ACC=CAM_ASM_000861 /TAXON_ID=933848 /ORGANISM="Elphidium margaritaceum" /LENGTH=439 /DNA_ID=CAMNT_0049346651 /DNA_START=89 /DNA_END=1408 /DNA_ORIENTATION=+
MGCMQQTPALSLKNAFESKEDKEERQRRADKRTAAIKELIETEKTYVNGLDICLRTYYERLSAETKLVSAKDFKVIFNDLKTIHQLNDTFLTDLNAVYANFDNDQTRIGDQFVKFCPYFRMYQNYCNNYDAATELLTRYNEKQSFVNLCMEIRDETKGKTLQSLLILPIQRLPRYKMCLTEILKNTENNHPDMTDLRRALEAVEETTTLINERMKEHTARQQVREIESRFSVRPSLLKPHRKFIREGLMKKVDKTGKSREYMFFLFNDMLCYASGENKTLKMHQEILIDEAFYVTDVPHHDQYNDCAFEFYSSVKSFIVYCNESRVKHQWLSDLQSVVKDGKLLKRELSAPLMVPDDWSDECQMKDCDTKFTMINRRHHCRYCGKLICKSCGKYKLASRVNKDRVVKPVCKQCFYQYNAQYPANANAKEEEEHEQVDSE